MRTLMWQLRCCWLTAAASFPSILVCLVSLICLASQAAGATSAVSCGPGIDTPGVTFPRGDIIIEHGNPLEILCVLDLSHPKAVGKSARDLMFMHDNTQVPSALVSVVNETTIRLYVEKPPPSKRMYYCKLVTKAATLTTNATEEGVCLNNVAIAFKPQEVINFTCISHNWENLTCTWKKPENHVKTWYTLRYRLPGRAGGRILFGCPNNTDINESRCVWDMSTDPHYRQPYEYYYFSMSGENVLGNVTFPNIKFHHYSHVLPASPKSLSLVNRTTNSVGLEWKIPFPMQVFPPGVIHKLRFQSEWEGRDQWQEVPLNFSSKPTDGRHFNLTGLKYANALYDMKVFIKSAAAPMGPEMWSFPANLTVKTAPTVPGAPPMTDIGSFEVSGGISRDVYVYWQHIRESLKNGENFEYKVYRQHFGRQELMEPTEATKAYSRFKDINQMGHRLVVYSVNREGHSRNHSSIFIPGHNQAPAEPLSFTKIAFGNGTYELSWRPAESRGKSGQHATDNYTIFWCDNERDRPYQCNGYLRWLHVPGNLTAFNISVSDAKIFQFAISANSHSGSSGMVWASCTVIHDKIVGKMKNVWMNNIKSRVIEVGWKLDCSDRAGMVIGFLISYCPIVGPQDPLCKEPEKNVTVVGDPTTSKGIVDGLRPYTTYMVQVGVLTKSGGGQPSLPLFNTTLEAAPDSPPHNVTFSEITNSSILVSWQPPAVTNGLLRDYELTVTDHKVIKVERATSYELKGLVSYKNYTVSVAACTVKCSRGSDNITVQTGVGAPSIVDRPTVVFLNSSEVVVSWRPPSSPAGALDRYELLFQQKDTTTNTSTTLYISKGLEAQVPVPDCKGEGASMTYSFLVRAVNVGPADTDYPGTWSEPGETNCYTKDTERNMLVIWVFSLFAIILACACLGYMGKRVWQRCKVMQDVEVKLPPGLAPISEKDSGKIHVHSWPGVDSRDDSRDSRAPHTPHSAPADEELLLHKKERHGRNASGGSSGCSSGHESVSSSRTSGTHMSSDSGTEQDQRPASPDGVFSESPPWECASLGGACVDGSYVRMGKLAHAPLPAGSDGSVPDLTGLPGLGALPGPLATWHSTGYISMPSSEELSAEGDNEGDMVGPGGDREGVGYCRVGLEPAKGYVSIASISRPGPVPVVAPGPGRKGEAYCRMGLQTPLAPAAVTQGYVALPDSPDSRPAVSAPAGYVPHARFDKKEEMLTATVFAPTEARSRIGSPTASV